MSSKEALAYRTAVAPLTGSVDRNDARHSTDDALGGRSPHGERG